MTKEQRNEYTKLVELYNHNLTHIRRQLNSFSLRSLINEYKAIDDSHLCKILSLRGIRL